MHKHPEQNGIQNKKPTLFESFEDTPLPVAVLTYLGYGILILFGHLCDLLRKYEILYAPFSSEKHLLKVCLYCN